ncbi:MAG: 2-amino-4-hydroxy-6-hydroxymethyldihydropteridine diphosphokinase [Sphingomonadaceae bacterium]|nr:2-amino-4-hydroxy-6-hydroxymethyldihydropteridine diphosphokinase [Sphingomonadaceae bacterium]
MAAAVAALGAAGLRVVAMSRVRSTPPLGPRQRRFANAVAAVATDLPLAEVLTRLKAIERAFGRRRGRRWGPRVLDLDLVAAGKAVVRAQGLTVPHIGLAERRFVLDPLAEIAPGWRHPLLGATARQLRARAHRPRRSAAVDP